jgi:SAM-dependent methyltransferase
MDRRDAILKYATKEQRGIEIGPWFNPIAPKREGYRCLTLDVFDSETLRKRAADDPNISAASAAMIEDVDLVGSSTRIGELVRARGESGTFDYVVSSHNFEHLPNPVRFLQGCSEALRPGGILSMAIPDHRACFDYFRPVTRLSEWIQAFVEDRSKPSRAQDFDSRELFARFDDGKQRGFAFYRNSPPEKVSVDLGLDVVFGDWMERQRTNEENYYDAHCSVFTPSSFELLIRDAAYLGLVPFEVVEIFDAGCEFHAHLRSNQATEALRPADHERIRNALLLRIQDEAAETSTKYQEMRLAIESLPMNPDGANEQIHQLTMNLDGANERIHQLTMNLDRANGQIHQLEDTIRGLRTSTSWRITEPLRRLTVLLRNTYNRSSRLLPISPDRSSLAGHVTVDSTPTRPDHEPLDKNTQSILVEGVEYDSFRISLQRRENEELYNHRLDSNRDLARVIRSSTLKDLTVSEASLRRMNRLTGTTALEALHILDGLRRSQQVLGDVCEFGVAQGRTSALIASVLLETHSPKNLWLYDSFEGLPKPCLKDILLHDLYGLGSIEAYEGLFSIPEQYVTSELADVGFPPEKTKIVKGWIESQVLQERLPDQISFAYLDMDFYQSTKDVLGALITRMPPGGQVVVDDYGFFSSGVRTAVEEISVEFPGYFEFDNPFGSKFALLTKSQ